MNFKCKFLTLFVPALMLASATHTYAAKPPNILLIVADDLGYSDIQPFGAEIHTPNLQKLTEKGTVFNNFYSGPTCSITRSMLLTGNDNHQAGVGTMTEFIQPEHKGKPGYEGYLNQRVISLAEILQQKGYFTLMSGKWHLGNGDDSNPNARGFKQAFALMPGGAAHFDDSAMFPIKVKKPIYFENGKPYTLPEQFYSSNYFTDKFLSYLKNDRNKDQPFFGYLAFTAPHWPLQAPNKDIKKYENFYKDGYEAIRKSRLERMVKMGLVDQKTKINNPLQNVLQNWDDLTENQKREQVKVMQVYAAMIDNMDQNIGRVIDHLEQSGELDNTLILFTSDNGAEGSIPKSMGVNAFPRGLQEWVDNTFDNSIENLGRKGSYATLGPQWAQVSSTPYPFFKSIVSQGGVKVPTIVRYPKLTAENKLKTDTVHVIDFVPTVLDLLSIEAPKTRNNEPLLKMEGTSFLPVLKNKKMKRNAIGWEFNNSKALIKDQWFVQQQNFPFGTGQWQLFNLDNDPTLLNDLANKEPKKVKNMVVEWNNYAKRVGVVEAPIRYTYGQVICFYETCIEPDYVKNIK